MIAIIGGEPARFRPLVDLFHRALDALERPRLPIGVHSPGYVSDTDDDAAYTGAEGALVDAASALPCSCTAKRRR